MSTKVAKVALTKSEVNFFVLCSDVFQTFGLAGLLDLARNVPCTNERDEVFFALAQDVFITLRDEYGKDFSGLNLEALFRILRSDFQSRSNHDIPEGVDVSGWNDKSNLARTLWIQQFFMGRARAGIVSLQDMPETLTTVLRRKEFFDMLSAAAKFRV